MFPLVIFKVVKSIHIPFLIISLNFVRTVELQFPLSDTEESVCRRNSRLEKKGEDIKGLWQLED